MNIELLDEAISRGRKVSFHYAQYGTDKKLHDKARPDGAVREYVVSPYQMAAREGKYYLICNYDKYDDISNTNIYLKGDTERRGFFVSGKEDAAGNTVCIPKAADAAWREKDRREWLLLIRY